LKRKQRNIFYGWVLLLCFTVGQYIVFTHTHIKQLHRIALVKSTDKAATVKEACDICDAMHHTHAVINQQVYFAPPVSVQCHYQFRQSDVTPIQLIIAAGRAPPVVIS